MNNVYIYIQSFTYTLLVISKQMLELIGINRWMEKKWFFGWTESMIAFLYTAKDRTFMYAVYHNTYNTYICSTLYCIYVQPLHVKFHI